MRKAETRTIDGLTLTVQQLPAMRSLRLMHRLSKSVGPALLKSLSGVKTGAQGLAMSDLNLADAGEGLRSALEAFSENDLEVLTRELLETATFTRDGNTGPVMPSFDLIFQGQPLTILKTIKFALEVNYGDFFGAFRGLTAGLPAPKSAE